MSIEVTVGSGCNLSCGYCYEHALRDAGNFGVASIVDFAAVTAALVAEGVGRPNASNLKEKTGFGLHGGEPLLMPFKDIERLARWAAEFRCADGSTGVPFGIQTNGSLVTAEHLDLFEATKTHVGFSLDGPGELNDSRWAGSREKTASMTARSFWALAECQRRGISHSVIITLHRLNAAPDRLPALCAWLTRLDADGTGSVRLHTLEVDNAHTEAWVLSTADQFAALEAIARLPVKRLTFDIFADMEALLSGSKRDLTCVYNACDPLTTNAVRSIETDGSRKNCARTYKDGVAMQKAVVPGGERQLALYYTPQQFGGCAGCRFFFACKGHCPGEGLDGDWRNRSASCEFLKAMFEAVEDRLIQRGVAPLSRQPQKIIELERKIISGVRSGDGAHGDGHGDAPHGDHTDAGRRAVPVVDGHGDAPHGDGHGDAPHGDRPHGDGRLA